MSPCRGLFVTELGWRVVILIILCLDLSVLAHVDRLALARPRETRQSFPSGLSFSRMMTTSQGGRVGDAKGSVASELADA